MFHDQIHQHVKLGIVVGEETVRVGVAIYNRVTVVTIIFKVSSILLD